MSEPNQRRRAPFKTSLRVGILAAIGGMFTGSTCPDRVSSIPSPLVLDHPIDVQGALLTAQAYADTKTAEQAFGFDIRGAGLLPVRLAIDNRSRSVVKVNPQQTFLIDRQGLAWPLLTADQARDRVASAAPTAETAKTAATYVQWGSDGTLTGFAMGVIAQGGYQQAVGTERLGPVVAAGSAANAHEFESRIRKDLVGKSLRNQRLQPGELAYGYLFFPGREEAQATDSLRLVLDMDGHIEVAQIPLRPDQP